MTFQTEIQKASNERSTLVRIEAQVALSDVATSTVAGQWQYKVLSKPTSVEATDGGTILFSFTEDDTLSSEFTWSYDSATRILTIRRTTPDPDEDTLVTYFLTVTDAPDQVYTIDPIVGGNKVMWEDRLKTSPKITESIDNVVDGVLTVTSSSISLENSDQFFNTVLSTEGSLNGREIKVWFNVGGELSLQFQGTVRTVDITGTTIVVGMVDQFTKLDSPSYLGSTEAESIHSGGSLFYKDAGRPIPMQIGKVPDILNTSPSVTLDVAGLPNPAYVLNDSSTYRAVCTDYTGPLNAGRTNNRTWTLCRYLASQTIATVNVGTVTNITERGTVTSTLMFNNVSTKHLRVTSSGFDVEVGDGMIELVGASNLFGVIFNVDATGYDMAQIGSTPPVNDVDRTATSTMVGGQSAVSLVVKDLSTGSLYPVQSVNHAASQAIIDTSPLSNGTRQIDMVFADGYGGSSLTQAELDPEFTEVYYRVRFSSPVTSGELVQQIFTGSGLTVNSASADAVDTTTGASECLMTIPSGGSSGSHTTLRKTLSEVVGSTLGYVRADNSGETFYELFDAPTGVLDTRDDNEVLSSSVIPRISYYDTFANIIINNSYTDEDTEFPKTVTDERNKLVFSADKDKQLSTVFDTVPTSVETRIKNILLRPRVKYKYRTASMDLNTQLGQGILLKTSSLLGDVEEVKILVTKVIKSTTSVDVVGLQIKE